MLQHDALELRLTQTRQTADDLEGQAGATRRDRSRMRGVPLSAIRSAPGPQCDASDPGEWAGDPDQRQL